MNKRTLNVSLMVMFFFISTAFVLASFYGSKDTRSRAASEIPADPGGPYGKITSAIEPTLKPTIKPTLVPTIKPTLKPTTIPTVQTTIKATISTAIQPTTQPEWRFDSYGSEIDKAGNEPQSISIQVANYVSSTWSRILTNIAEGINGPNVTDTSNKTSVESNVKPVMSATQGEQTTQPAWRFDSYGSEIKKAGNEPQSISIQVANYVSSTWSRILTNIAEGINGPKEIDTSQWK
jgi:hypothetical protein